MLYRINCRHCGQRVSFEDPALGATVPCPHCKQPLQLSVTGVVQEPESAGSSPAKMGRKPLALIGIVAVLGLLVGAGIYFLKFGAYENLPELSDAGRVFSRDDRMTVNAPSNGVENVVLRKTRNYEVTLRRNFPVATIWVCEVNYLKGQPSSRDVDETLREYLEKCARLQPDQEIIAMPFITNSPMPRSNYSGPLVWKPDQQKILSMNR